MYAKVAWGRVVKYVKISEFPPELVIGEIFGHNRLIS